MLEKRKPPSEQKTVDIEMIHDAAAHGSFVDSQTKCSYDTFATQIRQRGQNSTHGSLKNIRLLISMSPDIDIMTKQDLNVVEVEPFQARFKGPPGGIV